MNILSLSLEGFRSFKKVEWEPENINLIISPSSSEKSNFIKGLDLLLSSSQGELEKFFEKTGGFNTNRWKNKAPYISLQLKVSVPSYNQKLKDIFTYELIITRSDFENTYRIFWERLFHFKGQKDQEKRNLLSANPKNNEYGTGSRLYDKDTPLNMNIEDFYSPRIETILSGCKKQNIENPLIIMFQKHLSSWNIYNEISYNGKFTVEKPIKKKTKIKILPDFSNFIEVLYILYSKESYFKKEINEALKKAIGDDFEAIEFITEPNNKIKPIIKRKSQEQPLEDFPKEIISFIALLTILLNPNRSPLLVFNCPEKKITKDLLSIIIPYIKKVSIHSQLLITTNSLLLTEELNGDNTKITTIETQEDKSQIKTLKDNEINKYLS